MISINTYILEKLNINKDIEIEDKEIKCLTDLYEIGDKCLIVKLKGIGFNPKVHLDAIEITDKSKTILRFKCLTNTGWSCEGSRLNVNRNNNMKINSYKAAWTDSSGSPYLIVPYNESKDVVKEIEDNDLKLKSFSNLYVIHQEPKEHNYPIVEMKNKGLGEWDSKNLKLITKESFNEIKKALNV